MPYMPAKSFSYSRFVRLCYSIAVNKVPNKVPQIRSNLKRLPLPFVGRGWPKVQSWEDFTRSRRPGEGLYHAETLPSVV